MKKRQRLKETKPGKNRGYFTRPSSSLKFTSTGCCLLNCVLSGGYAQGRIINIVGDKSTGKTLLAIEATANFAAENKKGLIRYNEVEAAFDKLYAKSLGLPLDRVEFAKDCFTVEDVFNDLNKTMDSMGSEPGIYVLDSLDALSDKAELERDMEDGSYNMEKAKKMSQLFRRLTQKTAKKNLTIFIISQVRDNIGVTFGRQTIRTGGRALDFYASQVLYLAQIRILKRTIKGIERPTGVVIRAKCDKNKVGLPFRECDFPIEFGYGIDEVTANVEWLAKVGRLDVLGYAKKDFDKKEKVTRIIRNIKKLEDVEFKEISEQISEATKEVWFEIETRFLPERKKY